MSEAYYYFTATLPLLQFESDPPMTEKEFLAECTHLLTVGDTAIIRRCLANEDGIDTEDETVNAIACFNREFLDETVYFRMGRSHKDSAEQMNNKRSSSVSVIEAIRQASKMENLLEAETLLDKTLWENWDNLLLGRTSGLAAVLVYGLKLGIVNRYREIRTTKGRDMLEEIKKADMALSCNVN